MALDLVVLVVCVNGYSSDCGGADGGCSFFLYFLKERSQQHVTYYSLGYFSPYQSCS